MELRRQRRLPSDVAVAWAGSRLCGALLGLHGLAGESRAEVIDDCVDLFEPELCAAFEASGHGERTALAKARRGVRSLIAALPAIQRTLMLDLHAAYERDPAATSRMEIALAYPGIRALCTHRIAHHFHGRGVPLVPRMIAESAHRRTGIDIHPGASIAGGLFIDHGTGVVIGETTVIGRQCRIYQGVTLGALTPELDRGGGVQRGQKRHPTLGDRVVVYAGATILGGDTVIGDGATVNGGVFLVQSVPAGSVAQAPRPEVKLKSRD